MKDSFLFTMAVCGIVGNVYAESVKGAEALTVRQQSIVAVAALSGNGNLDKLEEAVTSALDNGLTVNEIGEIMLQTYAYAGFPRSLNAQGVLSNVLSVRSAGGIEDVYGEKPQALPQTGRYDIGRENVNKLVNGNAKQSRPEDTGYVATTDVFLKEHLFADIIERDNLSYADRELVTVSILSGIMNVNPQLAAHMNGALNVGNTKEQLEALIKVLGEKVGKAEAKNAKKVFDQVIKRNAQAANNSGAQKKDEKAYPPEARVSAFEVGQPNDGFAKYFTGRSYLNFLNRDGAGVANVTFEPGCINNWHIHHSTSGGGQLLIAVGGRGYYQLEGQKPVMMKAGDVALMPANVKHWHGAAKDSWFSHLSIEVPGTDCSNEWLEPVNQSEYDKLK